jgi:glycine/D-amino acid oxidase-like deaminating enzyme
VKRFDIIVIGKGLVGTAAAKYISASQPNIAIIGPDEPQDNENALVFASHYDQSRVQRLIGKDEAWTKLNIDSVNQYETIRQQSGIEFHDPVGCLYVQPSGTDDYLDNARGIGDLFQTSFRAFHSGNEINKEYKDFRFPEASNGLLESSPAGSINPRQLVKAQLNILEKNGGTFIRDTVINISLIGSEYLVETSEGSSYFAHRILLAPGSFINYFNLLQQKLDLVVKSEVILLAMLNEKDALQLSSLPSLLYETDNGEVEGIYMVRPVRYPDGNWYLKMGCNMPEDILFENISQVQHWFRGGDSDRFIPRMKEALMNFMPGLRPEAFMTKRCIINRSVHGRPYIGETKQPGLYVASGCNGYSAMCSDAIGHVTAEVLVNGRFPPGYSYASFEPVYKDARN